MIIGSQSATLELRGVTKRYGDAVVLDCVNLTVKDGEAVAIVGSNGAGKTSLLRVAASLDIPSSGTVLYSGRSPARSLARGFHSIGVFPDISAPGGRTVLQHVQILAHAFGVSARRVRFALESVGLLDFQHQEFRKCSAGMRQKVALAAVWLRPCDLVLLDEPTSFLDDDGEALIGSMIERIVHSGGSVVVATHENSVASQCHSTLVIQRGSIGFPTFGK